MEFLGVGPFELLLILVIALIVLGPDDMVKAGTSVGKFIRKFRKSETWLGFQRMSRSLRTLPEDLARESGIEDMRKQISEDGTLQGWTASPKKSAKEYGLDAWTNSTTDTLDNIQEKTADSTESKISEDLEE